MQLLQSKSLKDVIKIPADVKVKPEIVDLTDDDNVENHTPIKDKAAQNSSSETGSLMDLGSGSSSTSGSGDQAASSSNESSLTIQEKEDIVNRLKANQPAKKDDVLVPEKMAKQFTTNLKCQVCKGNPKIDGDGESFPDVDTLNNHYLSNHSENLPKKSATTNKNR